MYKINHNSDGSIAGISVLPTENKTIMELSFEILEVEEEVKRRKAIKELSLNEEIRRMRRESLEEIERIEKKKKEKRVGEKVLEQKLKEVEEKKEELKMPKFINNEPISLKKASEFLSEDSIAFLKRERLEINKENKKLVARIECLLDDLEKVVNAFYICYKTSMADQDSYSSAGKYKGITFDTSGGKFKHNGRYANTNYVFASSNSDIVGEMKKSRRWDVSSSEEFTTKINESLDKVVAEIAYASNISPEEVIDLIELKKPNKKIDDFDVNEFFGFTPKTVKKPNEEEELDPIDKVMRMFGPCGVVIPFAIAFAFAFVLYKLSIR